jgi:DNA-binding response OmpR family regulator
MPATAKLSVLLIEDDVDIAFLEAQCLEAEGYTVFLARNGRHALELLALTRPAVIVLDLMMPELDGFGFLAEYRARPLPRPPVVVVSAFEAYLAPALEQGAAGGLAKPFSPDELLRAVNAAALGATEAPRAREVPLDERQRLAAVLALKLDEPSPSAALDAFAQRVARIFDVPICLVSIVTRNRQFWHAQCGLPPDLAAARGTPRDESFCTHAVVAQAALVVQDTLENPFFAQNVLVRTRGLRFYAGVPLITRLGGALGTLCLLDVAPRAFGALDLELLSVLSRRVVAELEWRERRLRPGAPRSAFRHLSWLDEELDVLGREAFEAALQVESLRATQARTPLALAVVVAERARLLECADALKASLPRALVGRLGMARLGVLAPGAPSALAEHLRAAAGAGGYVHCAEVPRLLGGAEAFLRAVEEAAGSRGIAPAAQ